MVKPNEKKNKKGHEIYEDKLKEKTKKTHLNEITVKHNQKISHGIKK
jgi:hypothetical protein